MKKKLLFLSAACLLSQAPVYAMETIATIANEAAAQVTTIFDEFRDERTRQIEQAAAQDPIVDEVAAPVITAGLRIFDERIRQIEQEFTRKVREQEAILADSCSSPDQVERAQNELNRLIAEKAQLNRLCLEVIQQAAQVVRDWEMELEQDNV